MERHEAISTRSDHYSPRVEGSIPVRGHFFAEVILLQYNSEVVPERSILGTRNAFQHCAVLQ